MNIFTEEELDFAKVEGAGSIAMVKRIRTREPYDSWFVVDQVETCDDYRKRTTRTHTELADASYDYQKRLAIMKAKRGAK